MKRNLMGVGFILCAGLASAGTLTWNGASGDSWDTATQNWLDEASSPAAWADGSVAMFKTAGTVLLAADMNPAGLTFDAAAASVALTNGTITTDAITANNQVAVIASKVAATNGLTVTGNGVGSRYFSGVLTTSDQVLFRNLSITDVKMFTADMGTTSTRRNGFAMVPVHIETNATTWAAQYQIFEGDWSKCVKAQFTQSGADIVGRIIWAKYYKNGPNTDVVGMDFSSVTSASGYNLQHIRAITDESDLPRVELTGGLAVGGTLTVGAGRVRVDGTVTNAIVNNGAIVGSPDGWTVLSGKISGRGTIICPAPSFAEQTLVAENTGYVPTSATVFFHNVKLSQIVSAGGKMGGRSVSSGLASYDCEPWFCRNDGTAVYVQLQFFDSSAGGSYQKCVKIKFTQAGDDVAAQAVGAAYIDRNGTGQHLYGYDFDDTNYGSAVATSASTGSYGIHDLSITLGQRMSIGGSDVTATNTFTGGVIVNGTLVTRHIASLPWNGSDITVNDGGNLILSGKSVSWDGVGGSWNQILVNRGGTLTVEAPFLGGSVRPIILNGGMLSLPVYSDDNGDCWNYLNRLYLKNGARIVGNPVRVGGGGYSNSLIRADGDAPSSIESGIALVGSWGNTDWNLSFDVADVTGDAKPDLLVPSAIKDFVEFGTNLFVNYSGMRVVKTGAGTASLSGYNTYTGITDIAAGTLSIDAAHALNTNIVRLTGGTLAINAGGVLAGAITAANASVSVNGAGFSAGDISLSGGTLALEASGATAGALVLPADATLALGADAGIAFANSSGAAWADGAALTVTGELGKTKVRFGTDATGLTEAQLGQIYYGGHKVILDADGYLRRVPQGLVMSLQ
jgi:autotransporter-associated beta strand protein